MMVLSDLEACVCFAEEESGFPFMARSLSGLVPGTGQPSGGDSTTETLSRLPKATQGPEPAASPFQSPARLGLEEGTPAGTWA